jgi:AraC-like DNA-binding protein
MAAQAKVTRRRLHSYFLITFERDPDLWLESLRLRIAKKLLAQGKNSKEIADAIGFAHRSTFCQFFQRLTGRTPLAFAKSWRESGLALPVRSGPQDAFSSVSGPSLASSGTVAVIREVDLVIPEADHSDIPPVELKSSPNPTQKSVRVPQTLHLLP